MFLAVLLALSTFTLTGIVVGFGLWFGLLAAVFKWGPSHNKPQGHHHHPGKRRDPPQPPYGSIDE